MSPVISVNWNQYMTVRVTECQRLTSQTLLVYSVAESEEVPELRNPSEGMLLRRLLEDLRSGQIKYRCADRCTVTSAQGRSNTGAVTDTC